MSVLIPGGPVLVLPAGTETADAERLSRLLDAHGVSGLLGALDAVAVMVSVPATGNEPEPARKKTTVKPKGKARSTSSAGPWCGQPNRSGMPCRRPPSCPYHRRPVSDTAPAVATEVVPASVADEDGDGDEEVAEADGATDAADGGDAREAAGAVDVEVGMVVAPALSAGGCPKCGAPAAMVIVKRMPDQTADLVCLACGRRQLVGVNPLAA